MRLIGLAEILAMPLTAVGPKPSPGPVEPRRATAARRQASDESPRQRRADERERTGITDLRCEVDRRRDLAACAPARGTLLLITMEDRT